MIILPNQAPLAKPAGFARINPRHPFAANVMVAYFMHQRPPTKTGSNTVGVFDSGPNRIFADNSGATFSPGAYGNEVVIPSSFAVLEAAADNRHAPLSGQITMFARIKSTGGATQRNWVIMRGSTPPLSYWLCIHDNAGQGDGAGFFSGGYFVSGKNTNISADGLYHVVAGTIKNTGAATCDAAYYIDGRLDKKTSGLAAVMPTGAIVLDIGGYQGDASHFIGSIESVVVLNVALTPAQVAAVSRNLYAFIAPSRMIVGNLAAAAGATRRRTQPIIAS